MKTIVWEVYTKKIECEEKIQKLLETFMNETGAVITDVDISIIDVTTMDSACRQYKLGKVSIYFSF